MPKAGQAIKRPAVKPTKLTKPVEPPKPTFPYDLNALAQFQERFLALFPGRTLTSGLRNDLSQLALSCSQWDRDAILRIVEALTTPVARPQPTRKRS